MNSLIPVLLAMVALWWVNRPPKFDWTPAAPDQTFSSCPGTTQETLLIFGGTSMLGRYIVDVWREKSPKVCLVNYSRKNCPKCHVNVYGDIRDTKHIERVYANYKPETVLTSTKPPMTGVHYRTFLEVNTAAIFEVTRLAKEYKVKDFIHVSSIAARNHYEEHIRITEDAPQPLYTDYQAAYDLSKRLGEDFVLHHHQEGKFNTIALRVSGIIGGEGDEYFHHRWFPFLFTFDSPVIVDYGFAANIALALHEMAVVLDKDPTVGGEYYYYTGEHILENITSIALASYTGKPLFRLPTWMLTPFLEFWQWIRWEHNVYTIIDLLRCANVEQTFDQTKFHNTFPNFKPKYTVLEGLKLLYGKEE